MKNLIIFGLCILFLSCNTEQDLKSNANSFVKAVILDNVVNSEELEKYVLINPNLTDENKTKFIEYLQYMALEFKKSINRRSSEYYIVSHDELKSDTKIKKEYNLKYENKNNIFYLVSGSDVITHIIFNSEGKVISFFPGLHQGQTDHSPIMLDTFDDFK